MQGWFRPLARGLLPESFDGRRMEGGKTADDAVGACYTDTLRDSSKMTLQIGLMAPDKRHYRKLEGVVRITVENGQIWAWGFGAVLVFDESLANVGRIDIVRGGTE